MAYPENKIVSVVIPAYNHEQYIDAALKSVLCQTHENLEIVIVDDGSSDSTGDICRKTAAEDRRVKYFRQENQGAHVAINNGIEYAEGEYLAILNSDDIFYPEKISRCMEICARNPGVQFVAGHPELMDSKGKTLKKGIEAEWQVRAYNFYKLSGLLPMSVLNENFIATTSNMFFSRELFNKNGGFQPLRYCHDLDFLLSSFRNGPYYLDWENTHIKYRVHPGNTIKEDIRKIRIEIAAVIAAALVTDNRKIIVEEKSENLVAFRSFLENKNLSNLIIFLMMEFLHLRDRTGFYEKIAEDRYNKLLMNLLGD